MPIKHWIVSSKMSDEQAASVREALLSMDKSELGQKALAASGYKGFIASDTDLEKTLTNWLGL
jgi:ABC-type phosphate/phosphonate transport system substrate-binding protein